MSNNNDGQGEDQGSKTGMGIDQPMNAHALLIGVGRCQYSEWSLPVTVLDALELRKTLIDPDLGAYPDKGVRIVRDEEASREGILRAIDDLAETAAADPDATILVYYSGHGWRHADESGERFFLIPHDVRPHELTASALPAEDFIRSLRRLRSRRVLIMIDTCHAAGMAGSKTLVETLIPKGFAQDPLPKALVDDLSAGEGRAVFLSCHESQKSWILPGEGSLSIFTHHLLAALKGANNATGDRFVTVSNLMGYLGEKVPISARELGKEQTPFFKFEAQEFPVALVRGGKGLPEVGEEVSAPSGSPAPSSSRVSVGEVNAEKVVVADTVHELNMN